MRVLLIGGTGFMGGAVADCLQAAGHEVLSLARSEKSAAKLRERGLDVCLVLGGLQGDASALEQVARGCGAVVDVAAHNFKKDIPGVLALRRGLGAGGVLIATAGANFYGDLPGTARAKEDMGFGWRPREPEAWPKEGLAMMQRLEHWWPKFEAAALGVGATDGVSACILRPPLVYGLRSTGGMGMGRRLGIAAKAGYSLFIDDMRQGAKGTVHVEDLADLYLLVLEKLASGALPAGSVLNASAGNVTCQALAEAVAAACGSLPVRRIDLTQAKKTLGALLAEEMTMLCVQDSSAARALGWQPKRPGLVEDLSKSKAVTPSHVRTAVPRSKL